MIAYKLTDDCYEIGYYKTKLGVAKQITRDEDYFSQWFDSHKEYLEVIKNYENNGNWEEYIKELSNNNIYVEEIEIIEE